MKVIHFCHLGFNFAAHIGFKIQQKIPNIGILDTSIVNSKQRKQWLYQWVKQQIKKINKQQSWVFFDGLQVQFVCTEPYTDESTHLINVNDLFVYWFCSILSENPEEPTKISIRINANSSFNVEFKDTSTYQRFMENAVIQLIYHEENIKTVTNMEMDTEINFVKFLQKNPQLWEHQVNQWHHLLNHKKTSSFFQRLKKLNTLLALSNFCLLLLLFH